MAARRPLRTATRLSGTSLPVSNLLAHRTVHHDFNGNSAYGAITVSEVHGALFIDRYMNDDYKLNKKSKIDALPDDLGFIGETRDAELAYSDLISRKVGTLEFMKTKNGTGSEFRIVAVAALLTAIVAQTALGQTYPSRPIRLLVPFAPGGGSDVIARIAAQKLTEAVGQQVIVENRPGAGGSLGADIVAKAPPDGYTIFSWPPRATPSGRASTSSRSTPPNDITPIIQLSQGAFVLARASVAAGEEREGADRAREGEARAS